MIVTVLSRDRLSTVALPANVTGGHWIDDARGARLAFIEGVDGCWRIEPHTAVRVRGAGGDAPRVIELEPTKRAVLNLEGDDGGVWCLMFYPDNAGSRRSQVYGFTGDVRFTVGRGDDNAIVYGTHFVSEHHAQMEYRGGSWTVTDLDSANGVFVNGCRIPTGTACQLAFGDVISLLNLHITVGSGLFSCNDPGELVSVSPDFVRYRATPPVERENASRREHELFYPALRFMRTIESKQFTVDAPPQPEPEDETSLAARVGPSAIMASVSLLSLAIMPSVLTAGMAAAMLSGSVVWPIINSRSQAKRRAQKEARRRAAYSQYLSRVLTSISEEEASQRAILNENRISVQECLNRAYAGDARLMERTSLHADYLELRIGVGDEPLAAEIRFPERHFSLEDDEIRRAVDEQAAAPRVLTGVPVAYPLIEKPVLGVIGDPGRVRSFVRGMIVQLATLYSYEDVKLIVLADEADRDEWAFALHLPHCFSDDRAMRYVAFGLEETAELSMFMERVLEFRRSRDGKVEARDAHPYYVVVCASEEIADKSDIVRALTAERENLGVSLISCAHGMRDLPRACRSVIGLEDTGSYLLDRDDPSGTRRAFAPDIEVGREAAAGLAFSMGKIRLDIKTETSNIPARLGFLEMEHAGSIEHLSIAQRWRESNASATLAAPVGVDAAGEPFLLNLHEKFHGPHGLIAGTTGSGKSEFIITYILSMAVTYSPNDVAFVLIDYKGGGLAKAFDNEHVRLPHLAGVITNLDGAAITRSLVSINSELKRRQELFNRARDIVGGDNVDIYSYLDLFRQERVSEPCPHLFIVADEFAELKQQQPEFMEELISAARIGRSLGVHLILATQKPSGVVNDQIWSNARFKVCLKVADEADSREMIRRPDAAALTQAGRFYLLVGYNEHFALGQAAYAGTRYTPQSRFTATTDESVTLVSDTGRQLVSVKPDRARATGEDKPESVAVLQLLQEVAEEEGVHVRQLWLEPVPAMVTVDGVAEKYGRAPGGCADPSAFALDPVIGELDDPEHQRQRALTLPLAAAGGALVYGAADAGGELVLQAALYGMLRTFGPDALNVYALDFGSESLRAFAAAPQVGDVICTADEERVRRFFDFIEAVQVERRRVLAEYGGSFARFLAAGGRMPAIAVLVNDIAAFLEAYPKLEDAMVRLTREAGRYGIHLVMTADGTSSVRVRMRQSFRHVLAVNLADETDYSMIFGSMRGVSIPRGFGRGLVRSGEALLEFQAAHLAEDGDDYGCAAALSAELDARARRLGLARARRVPTVPDKVTLDVLGAYPVPAGAMPFGVLEDSLGVAAFDFEETPMARALFQRRRSGAAFMRAFVAAATSVPGWQVAVLDISQLLGDTRPQGCAFATRKPELAGGYLEPLLAHAADPAPARTLVVLSGAGALLAAAPYDTANELKRLLQALPLAGSVRVLLVDAVADVSYGYDDWFKAHITNKDGLWIGPGLDAQTAISTSYTPGLQPDSAMRRARGYLVEGGAPRLVRLVSADEDDEDKEVPR